MLFKITLLFYKKDGNFFLNSNILLQFQNVTIGYEKPILQQFNCSFSKEGIFCILGKSGCGKTTFFKLASGLLLPESGFITHHAQKISFLFQENRLLPWFTVLENMLVVNKDKEYCISILEELGLFHIEKKLPSALSGGMLRRVALAKAIVYDGDIFLLDEPFVGIDLERKQQIISFLKQKLLHKLCFIITHNIEEAVALSAPFYTLEKHCLKVVSPSQFVESLH